MLRLNEMGKGQSLDVILVNALEHHKKTMVVCEKRTALEVLHNTLNDLGLGDHCLLISDLEIDDEMVANSVRDSTDLELDHSFEFNSQEFNEQLELVQNGQKLFNEYKPYEELTFINPKKITGDNPNIIEQCINDDFQHYAAEIKDLMVLEARFKKQYFKIRKEELNNQINTREEIHQAIKKVIRAHRQSLEFLNEKKTNGFLYKMLSVFSGKRKIIIKDRELIRTLFTTLENHLNTSKDLPKFEFGTSIESNCWRLIDLKESVEKLRVSFNKTIAAEYKKLNLFDLNTAEYHTKSLDSIKEKGIQLAKKINTDKWLMVKVDVTSYDTLITDIERIIKIKNDYFTHKKGLFSIEIRWLQFYNGLSNTKRNLIDKLKITTDWRKAFLIYYLNALLIKLSGTHQLSDDDGPGELTESSSRPFFIIILITPDVCSDLFAGMNRHFDIVLTDKASHLRLKKNFPALLEGRQMLEKHVDERKNHIVASRKTNNKLISIKKPIETVISNNHKNSSLGVFNDIKRYLDDGYLTKVEKDVFKLHLFPKSGTDFHSLDQIAETYDLTNQRIRVIRSAVKQKLQNLILDLWKTSKHEQLYFHEQMFKVTKKDVGKINKTEQVSFDISFVNFVLGSVCAPGYYFQDINLNAPNYIGFFISPIPGFNFKDFFKDLLSVKDSSRNNDISFTLENLMSGYFDVDSQYIPNIHKPKIASALRLFTSLVNNEQHKIEVNESELKFVRTKE